MNQIGEKHRILIIFGTRPECIKLAPLFHELKNDKFFDVEILETGQHKDLLLSTKKRLNLDSHYNLKIMSPNQTLAEITVKAIKGISSQLNKIKPNMVIVQGDTTSAMSGALSAFYNNIPVAHVEAGLRTFDINEPYPEELNRKIISDIASLNLAPTKSEFNNLINEGVKKKTIIITGNTVIDCLNWALKNTNPSFQTVELIKRLSPKYIIVTLHRRENFGQKLQQQIQAIERLVDIYPEINFLLPVHNNPNVQKALFKLPDKKNIFLEKPFNYIDFSHLLKNCYFIITDSGGIQEEAPFLNKQVFILRDKTEREAVVKLGYATLLGSNKNIIINEISNFISNFEKMRNNKPMVSPYGDGQASHKIVKSIKKYFSKTESIG